MRVTAPFMAAALSLAPAAAFATPLLMTPWAPPAGAFSFHQEPIPQPFGFSASIPTDFERPEIVELRSALGFTASASLLEGLSADVSSSRAEWVSRAVRSSGAPDARLDTRAHVILLTTGFQQPLTDAIGIHARAGVARTRIWTFTDGSAIHRHSDTRPWFGLGASLRPFPLLSFSADYGKATDEVWAVRFHIDWSF